MVPVDRVAAPTPVTRADNDMVTVTVGVDLPAWGSSSTGRCSITSQNAKPSRWA